MKKLDNIEKLIWEHSAQVDLPSPPDKDAVWMRLSQHMDIDMNQDQQRIAPPAQRFLSKFKPHITYAVALGLALIFALPIAYDLLTTETLVTQKTDFRTLQLPGQ